MATPTTEALHQDAEGLDARPLADVANVLVEGQIGAATSVRKAAPQIAEAAEAVAASLRAGGVLHYVAAGSSGLMAAADALELGGTFSIRPDQIRIHMAGGMPTGVEMPGATEDETDRLERDLSDLSGRDAVIAVSASGTTPYTLAASEIVKRSDARLISIANNLGTPLLQIADIAICLETPPEVLSGSTRMGAGTAQKIALNMISTLMAVSLGHVHDGMMVNVYADNAKLRDRAARIVSQIASVSKDEAQAALDIANGEVKLAALIASQSLSLDEAQSRLQTASGKLREALAP